MDDYISREAATDRLEKLFHLQATTARAIIEAIPAADVRPVVRGRWEVCDWVEYDGHGGCIHYPREGLRCTNCRNAFKKELLWKENFCPNCGADMRDNAQ